MKASSKSSTGIRFGQFELDHSEGRLLKRGLPVHLEYQPFQILVALLGHPGDLVSREELSSKLWPEGTYVDFDEGLNTAIKKLRYALGDSAENPVFIETVPRRGYRFIAPVELVQSKSEASHPLQPPPPDDSRQLPVSIEAPAEPLVLAPPASKWKSSVAGLIGIAVVFVAACWLLYRIAIPGTLRVIQVTRLTKSGRLDPWGGVTSDGSRLFFLERDGDHWNDRQISVAGGESMPIGSSPQNTKFFAISNDQSEILFAPFISRIPDLPLWSMPLIGGAPRRVGDILVSGATFSPDGTKIAFTNSNGVFLANRDGSAVRQLAALHDCWDIAWSPDGKVLRFGQVGPRLWQVASTGGGLHHFLPSWMAWEGRWTPDGSYFIFSASKDGLESLWALRESPPLPWLKPTPVQLNLAPLTLGVPLPSRDGHSIYVLGSLSQQIDVVRFDPAYHQWKPLLPTLNVTEVEFSRDRQWMLYTDWNQLWRSRPDGSDRQRLAGPPSIPNISSIRWSPDSKHILFESLDAAEKGTIYLASAQEGPLQQPLPAGPSRRWPDWSPDGRTMVFTVEEAGGESSPGEAGLYVLDFGRDRTTFIPGSRGLSEARWSPDGRYLAAVSEAASMIKLLDLKTNRWREVARGKLISFPVWSESSMLYFEDILAPGEPVYSFQPGTSGPQRVYGFEDILRAGAMRCAFWGFAPDGSLLVHVSHGGTDIYSLTVSSR